MADENLATSAELNAAIRGMTKEQATQFLESPAGARFLPVLISETFDMHYADIRSECVAFLKAGNLATYPAMDPENLTYDNVRALLPIMAEHARA